MKLAAERRINIGRFKEDFCPHLMNRIYPKIKWHVGLKENKFLLFLNIIDRSSEENIKRETQIYGGIDIQRRFLDKEKKLDLHWEALKKGEILASKTKEGRRLYDEFRNGKLGIKDIYVGKLKTYFKSYFEGEGFYNELQEHEYPILDHHFDIENDHYMSLPLIQFGSFDGVVHIIFKKEAKNLLDNKAIKSLLIRMLSEELEYALLDWDLVGENINKQSLLIEQLNYLSSAEYQLKTNINPIFKELDYGTYYADSREHYESRLAQNDLAFEYLKNQHRKRAIISILIDSYAHNISAHSLTVLKWWFQQRTSSHYSETIFEDVGGKFPVESWGTPIIDFLMAAFPERYERKDIAQGLQYDLVRWYGIMKGHQENKDFKAVRDQFFSLERELTPLFKFLLEKGAFWSGVTRDQQFGGEIHNLYDILWNDFIRNPLYLGTIAYSEGITRLNISIRIYEEDKSKRKKGWYRNYKIKTNGKGIPLDGKFARVDVGGVPDRPLQHSFVEEEELHYHLKAILEQCEVFFPGGVVGKHAFFTLLENEIRNVKHFPEEDLQQMRTNGLNLVISIQPSSIGPDLGVEISSLYKIGIWLGHKTNLEREKKHLAINRFSRLLEDIITPDTNEARLGRTYQDKICAAMLFNGTFISVESKKGSARDEAFYPWVRIAYSEGVEDLKETDFELDYKKFQKGLKKTKVSQLVSKGFFKKYLHLWRGDFIYHVNDEDRQLEMENTNRFRLVNLSFVPKKVVEGDLENKVRRRLQRKGVIRIIEQQDKSIKPLFAYHSWLKAWFKESYFAIRLFQGKTEIGYFFFDKDKANYFTKKAFFKLPKEQQEDYGEYLLNGLNLKFDHGIASEINKNNILNISSHGIFKQKFFPDVEQIVNFPEGHIEGLELYELIEVLKTRVCIFDKRVADRVPKEKCKVLSEQLACDIFGEDLEDWEWIRTKDLSHYHFIIMHLSFIEAMTYKDDKNTSIHKGKRYGEEGIVDFVKERLGGGEKNEVILNDNTILVITTGRGRTAWWGKLQNSPYAPFSTFRPVESLIEAVEKAVLKNDDIEIKYNLVKVLFGS